MSAPPGFQCGDVISIFDYKFDDGTVADSKYFVVMGYHLGCAMGFLTTSQEKGGRKRVAGCALEFKKYPSNFYLQIKNCDLASGTWVLLSLESFDAGALLKKVQDGKGLRVATLSEELMRAVRNCFERSPEWAPICESYMCGGKTK